MVAVPFVGYLQLRQRCTQHQRPCGDRALATAMSAPVGEYIIPAPAVHVTPAPWYTIYSCASGAAPAIVYMTPASPVYAAPVSFVEYVALAPVSARAVLAVVHEYHRRHRLGLHGYLLRHDLRAALPARAPSAPPGRSLVADVMVPKGMR